MRLTLDALLVLDAIQRQGSFAAAADELHRVPSAVTYAVQKLEQDLGVALFDRSGHRAKLTGAGEELLREGRHLLRAAAEIESRVKRVATGWETELRIAVNGLIPFERVYPLVEEFYAAGHGTRLRLSREIFGGAWDALATDRSDLALGADGEGPSGGGYATRPMGEVAFVFVVAPTHPLASAPEPLDAQDILCHRAVAAADSSRNLPPRTSGLLSGQDVLTVPDLEAKRDAHCRGLGVGFMPEPWVREDLSAGRLLAKQVAEPKPPVQVSLAWRSGHRGNALKWFVKRVEDPVVADRLLG